MFIIKTEGKGGMKPLSKKTTMNKTEARYAQELETMKRSGEIIDYRFNGVRFRLADNTNYTPDFFIVYPGHFEVVEIKGFQREAGQARFKIAAEIYPWFRWRMVKWDQKQWETIYEF